MRDDLSFSSIQATRWASDIYCFSCEVAAWLVRLMLTVVHKNVSRQIGIAAGHQAWIVKGKTTITVYSPAPVCLVVNIWSRANGISRISFAWYVNEIHHSTEIYSHLDESTTTCCLGFPGEYRKSFLSCTKKVAASSAFIWLQQACCLEDPMYSVLLAALTFCDLSYTIWKVEICR